MDKEEKQKAIDDLSAELVQAMRARHTWAESEPGRWASGISQRDAEHYWKGKVDGLLFALRVLDPGFIPPNIEEQ